MMKQTPPPIDAVISWVDGRDPAHQQKLNATLSKHGKKKPASVQNSRLIDIGELQWCIDSLLINAPWIRTIFIVTDNQTPHFLSEPQYDHLIDKIKIVDHKEIFSGYEYALPTFNARSISLMLWRIKGLSEKFLYLNDDFLIIRPVKPEHFFCNQKLLINGSWNYAYPIKFKLIKWLNKKQGWLRKKIAKSGYLKALYLSGLYFDFKHSFISLDHSPHPMVKSYFKAIFEEHPQQMSEQVSFPFRSPQQMCSEGFVVHHALANNEAQLVRQTNALISKPNHESFASIKKRLNKLKNKPKYLFLCLQSLADSPKETQQYIQHWVIKDMKISYKDYPK